MYFSDHYRRTVQESVVKEIYQMSLVRQILPRFPISTIRSSFGYGSSVFPQRGNEGKDRQIDLILITGWFIIRFIVRRITVMPVKFIGQYAIHAIEIKNKNSLVSPKKLKNKSFKDNPLEFHRQNLSLNKDDYSYFMKAKSADSISNWNSKATGLYFNQFVKTEFGELKYGVISTRDFIKDLTNWYHLYIAGRLHKPVKV